jgi:hypothetical protein
MQQLKERSWARLPHQSTEREQNVVDRLAIRRSELVRRVGLGGPSNPDIRDRLIAWAEGRASSFEIGVLDGRTPLRQIGISQPGPDLKKWWNDFDEGIVIHLELSDDKFLQMVAAASGSTADKFADLDEDLIRGVRVEVLEG